MTDLADACALPVPRLPLADLEPEVDARAKATGTTALMGQFGHAPGLIESWLAWYQPLMLGGVVPTRTKELCRLAVAARTGCHMCQNGRFPDPTGGGAAVSEDDVAAVTTDRFDGFTPPEQAALAWTVAYYEDHKAIPDEVIQHAAAELGNDGFIELATMVAQFTGMGRLFSALGITAG
jgi:alkylhydroperoxidase family enzyme